MVWCTISLSLTFFWGLYHPGIDVGLDFVGWGAAWSLGILQLSESGSMSYDPEWSHLAGSERAGGVFVVLSGYVFKSDEILCNAKSQDLLTCLRCGHLALMIMAIIALRARRAKNASFDY